MKTKEVNIGRRIEHLLRTSDNPDAESNLCSSLDTAQKAEGMGLLIITLYRDDKYQPIAKELITNDTKLTWVNYQLTDKGRQLKRQLESGALKVKDSQRDEQLSWLLHQSSCLHYAKTPEPDKSYTWDTEINFLKDLGKTWMDYALDRLQIPFSERHCFVYSDHSHYDSPEFSNGLFSEAIAYDDIIPIDITLSLESARDWPVTLSLTLNVQHNARNFFRRVLSEYPKILSDILEYGHSLEFQCNVPLENEPKGRRPNTIEWFKAYFAPDETDEEEHFFLQTSFTATSTHHHTRKNFLAALALYESTSASFWPDGPQDRLLDFHQILCRKQRRLPKP